MEEFSNMKLKELIEALIAKGFMVAEHPMLMITKKDKTGYKTTIEVDLSQTFYVGCPDKKCKGHGRLEIGIDNNTGILICLDCKQPVILRNIDVINELKRKLLEDNV